MVSAPARTVFVPAPHSLPQPRTHQFHSKPYQIFVSSSSAASAPGSSASHCLQLKAATASHCSPGLLIRPQVSCHHHLSVFRSCSTQPNGIPTLGTLGARTLSSPSCCVSALCLLQGPLPFPHKEPLGPCSLIPKGALGLVLRPGALGAPTPASASAWYHSAGAGNAPGISCKP